MLNKTVWNRRIFVCETELFEIEQLPECKQKLYLY